MNHADMHIISQWNYIQDSIIEFENIFTNEPMEHEFKFIIRLQEGDFSALKLVESAFQCRKILVVDFEIISNKFSSITMLSRSPSYFAWLELGETARSIRSIHMALWQTTFLRTQSPRQNSSMSRPE